MLSNAPFRRIFKLGSDPIQELQKLTLIRREKLLTSLRFVSGGMDSGGFSWCLQIRIFKYNRPKGPAMFGLKLPLKSMLLFTVLAFAISSTGCRNCGSCGAPPYGVWNPFNGPVATTVPAPGTNTLNIPQTARQQPYYTIPNQGGAGIQPTPANTIPNYQSQPGWRQVPQGNNTSGSVNPNLTPTSFAVQNQGLPQFTTTATSQTINPNYRTTVVDERQDSSRLAVTDASQVRAPARFFPTGNMNRLAQTPVATSASAYPNSAMASQVGYGQPAQRMAQGPTAIRGSMVYQTNSAANPYGINPYANARVANYGVNAPVTSSNPTVLAQGSTSQANVASNTQSGWRNAQFNSQSNLNR